MQAEKKGSEETISTNTLILDFYSPDLSENLFLLFRLPICVICSSSLRKLKHFVIYY